MNYPEPKRTLVGGQLGSQRVGIDNLITEIFSCVTVGDSEDELKGIDLPPMRFDCIRARELIQNFMDQRLVGKGI